MKNKQGILSTARTMWLVNLALAPAAIVGVLFFGPAALLIILVSIFSAVATEGVFQKILGKKITIRDGSAFMTGLLLAFNLPPRCSLWAAALASIFAIGIAKQAFGGFGKNLFNPALAGRAFLMAFMPQYLSAFSKPFVYDVLTHATPLTLLKEGKASKLVDMGLSYGDLFLGQRAGCIGEVCIVALLLGGAFLLYKKIITWHIPLSFIVMTASLMWIFGGRGGFFKGDFILHLLVGGLMLGAIFMATDPVTAPHTRKGKIIFGLGCGFLTAVIRLWSGYPEGVCYAILIMNASVPLINKLSRAGENKF
jgi:electron transport complex protein RnfD